MTLTPEQKAAGWIEWSGGDCPIKDDRTLFAFFNRVGGCSAGVRDASSLSWLHQGSSSWDIIAYRIIEAHGADAEPARPTPFPRDYSELVWDADGWSQPFFTDGVWPEWLPDDAEWRFAPGGFAWHGRKAFDGEFAIRVRRREPKRETVKARLVWLLPSGANACEVIDLDLIDGKPDLSTLKIAENAL